METCSTNDSSVDTESNENRGEEMKKKMARILKGYVTFDSKVDYSEVEEIGGYLDCRDTDKDSFPKLTTIGGYLYCRDTDKVCFPKLKEKNCGNDKAMSKVRAAFRRKGFFLFDGILSYSKETRVTASGVKIHKTVIVGKTNVSFCVEADGVFAHGDTIKQAQEALIYKISDRDTSKYEGWTLDKKITKREAIKSYMAITGACSQGTKHFVESMGKAKSKYTVKEIIKLTKDQYGNETYRKFFE